MRVHVRSYGLVLFLLLALGVPMLATAQDLPDLGGREVTIAVENAYLPFNFIDP